MVKTDTIIRRFIVVTCLVFLMFVSKSAKAQYVSDYIYPDSVYVNAHSPNKATFYSAILPGMGQIYNGKYWKVPIIYAGIGGLIYYTNFNNYKYNEYKEAYDIQYRIEHGETELEPIKPRASAATLKNQKDYWKRSRNLTIISLGFLYVAQIIDADVDAHLFDYDMSEDLSLRFDPIIIPNDVFDYNSNSTATIGLRCSINF